MVVMFLHPRMDTWCIMARLFTKSDGHNLDSRDINEPYAHIFSNLGVFAIDGLGSVEQTNIWTDPFTTNSGSIVSNFTWGGGSYVASGGTTSELTFTAFDVGLIAGSPGPDAVIPFVVGSFVNPVTCLISFKAGSPTTFGSYTIREVGSVIPSLMGSSMVVKFFINRLNSGATEYISAIGVYYG